LAAYASGKIWAKSCYDKVVKRPDDMLEIVAYFYAKGGKTLPNAMKKGFAKSFDRFDAYQLAKYRGERKAVKLIDLVNLVHPMPTERNSNALSDLVNGNLKSTHTWEAKLTKAGQAAKSQKEKESNKAKAWKELIESRKIGYFALLRNLRNIAEQAPDCVEAAARLLVDPKLIKRSLVLPFRYLSALDAINESKIAKKRLLIRALDQALEISLSNVPIFEGRSLIVLDDSGSMTWGKTSMNRTPIQIGALFAAMLFKANDADLMRFSDNAAYVKMHFRDAAMSIADRLIKNARSGGTNFHAIFALSLIHISERTRPF